jgi:hypothetical protein
MVGENTFASEGKALTSFGRRSDWQGLTIHKNNSYGGLMRTKRGLRLAVR